MVGALLATLAAATFGTGDFLGGLAARRTSAITTMVVVQAAGLAAVVVTAMAVGAQVAASDLWFGAAAGLSGAVAFLLFYRAMSSAQMSVVAPVSAVLAAAVPVVVGVLGGERPPAWALVGMAVALPAVVLIGREPADVEPAGADVPSSSVVVGDRRVRVGPALDAAPVVSAALAGVGFGLVVTFLSRTGESSGMWPLVSARGTAVLVGALAAAVVRPSRPVAAAAGIAVAAGLLDALGNALYLLATRQGLLSVVGVIGALYPASTVLLARTVLGERLSVHQRVGLAAALVAVVLIAAA